MAETESPVDIHGTKCIFEHHSTDGVVKCTQNARQNSSVTHGWFCFKHYNVLRNTWKGK